MAKAEKNANASPPTGRPHELPISIRQAQTVSLWGWFPHLLAQGGGLVRAAVARLAPGRPVEHDYDAITDAATNLARETGVDDHLDPFWKRVRRECKNKRPRIKTPGRGQMRKICRPIWEAARTQIAKK
jgi:hypothetical protein